MKKDEYINSVLSVFAGRNKAMIADEFSSHLEDRIERFVEIGYTPEQAEQMAVEKMGDAQIVGARLTKIHSKKILTNICFILFFVYIGYTIALYFTILGWGSDMNLFTLGVEFSFLLLSVISLLIANRFKSNTVAAISLMFTALFFTGKFILSGFHSVLLYGTYLFLSGNVDDFIVISQLENTLSDNILLAFSIAFYLLWGASYAFTFANLTKFNSLKYSKRNVKYESCFKFIVISVLVFCSVSVALLFGFKLSDSRGEYLDGTVGSYYDGVCILESDEICDIEECYYDTDFSSQVLYKYYSWSTPNATASGYNFFSYACDFSDRKYNDIVTYKFTNLKSRYIYLKKYVAVVPIHFEDTNYSDDGHTYPIPCFDNVQWYDTDNTQKLTGSLNRDTDSVQTCGYSIELYNISKLNDDEAVRYVCDVIDSLGLGYSDMDDQCIEIFKAQTNSEYAGINSDSIYDSHHFIADDRMDVCINTNKNIALFYVNNELVYEYNYIN